MLKETETEETIGFVVIIDILVAFRLKRARAPISFLAMPKPNTAAPVYKAHNWSLFLSESFIGYLPLMCKFYSG